MSMENNNPKPIRVAQIIGKAINGGTESFAMNYYTNMDHSKVQFDFFVESTSKIIDKEKIESLGGKVVIIPSYTYIFVYIKTLKKLKLRYCPLQYECLKRLYPVCCQKGRSEGSHCSFSLDH